MNGPKTEPVSVGYGWARLDPGECVKPGDEFLGDAGEWIASSCIGRPARESGRIYRRRVQPTPGRWVISWLADWDILPTRSYATEAEAVEAAKKVALEHAGRCAVFHAVRAFERIEPVAAQVREVQI